MTSAETRLCGANGHTSPFTGEETDFLGNVCLLQDTLPGRQWHSQLSSAFLIALYIHRCKECIPLSPQQLRCYSLPQFCYRVVSDREVHLA